jgi:GDP-4-dehydro-6-deoxy-D-mannose reductase
MNDGATIVTGATGFAGRHLLDRLTGDANLEAWHRPGGRSPDSARQIAWRAVDLTNRESVEAAVHDSRPARLYHLAGAPNVAASWDNAESHLRINALGTHYLLDAVRAFAPGCRVLVVTSAQIYRSSTAPIDENSAPGPSNPYGLSKLAQDDLARRAASDGMNVVIARPFNHIGPLQEPGFAVSSFARQIARIERGLAPPELRVGNLEAERDITDVRDVVAAYQRVMEGAAPGRVYNVCSGQSRRIRALLDALLALSPVKIRVEIDPERFRPNDVPVIRGDFSRIHKELGWSPAMRIEDTLHDTLLWWRAETAGS